MSFVAVASTGIYCRAGCPAPAPKAANVGRVPTVEAARAAGYRACKRCRPDAAISEGAGGGTADVVLRHRGRRNLCSLLSFLATRAIDGVEAGTDTTLARTLRLAHGGGVVRVESEGGRVRCRVWTEEATDVADALSKVRFLLDLDRDVREIDAVLSADDRLARLMTGRRGTVVPGAVDGFEIAVRAILGQQVSVPGARTLAGRVTAAYGDDLPAGVAAGSDGSVTRLFPTPQRLAAADLGSLGMPRARAAAIVRLAEDVAGGALDLSPRADAATIRASLQDIPGVGPWTAEYVAMRALRDPDAFPATDLGVRKAMAALGVGDAPAAASRYSERWRPWRAYAVQYLWASLGTGAAAG